MKAFSANDDLGIMQWFFDLEPVARGFNWPIDVKAFVTCKAQLDELTADETTTANEMLAMYNKIAGALGPSVMNVLLESDDAFPEINRSGKPTPPSGGKLALFVDKAGKRVMAETTKQWGMPVQFTLE
jgi:hypothetical protein